MIGDCLVLLCCVIVAYVLCCRFSLLIGLVVIVLYSFSVWLFCFNWFDWFAVCFVLYVGCL